ncbi:hypothetical protein ACS0TY_001673 [Phlomoides rotata]
MGKKGSWFSSVKKALSPDSKGKKAEKAKKKWFGKKESPPVSGSPVRGPVQVSHPHPVPLLKEDVKMKEVEIEQISDAYSVPFASTSAAPEAASKEIQVTTETQFMGKSKEEIAAIKIQTTFRGYLARRALRALRGLVRLKSLVDGSTVKRQTANTLKCMQTLSRVHSQIQSRRIRMLEENRALQRQLLQKRAKELESLRMGEEWDDSLQSKEKIDASLLHKYEAAVRRERALAYSYTHQQTWKKSKRSTNLLFMDPTNPHWGWSWLERLMAAAPLDAQTDKDIKNAAGEITKSFARHQLNNFENQSPPPSQKPSSSHHSPATPSSKAARKLKHASPKTSLMSQDDDARSVFSIQSERNRRHSMGGSSIRDDESLASSPSIPSYMAPTRSAKAKSKPPSPLGLENGSTPDKESLALAKKRLSFPPSPARGRRHSGPPKVETSAIVNNEVNGGSIN